MSFESMAEGQIGVNWCGQLEEDCSTRWDRRRRKPVFRTGSEFSVSRLVWS